MPPGSKTFHCGNQAFGGMAAATARAMTQSSNGQSPTPAAARSMVESSNGQSSTKKPYRPIVKQNGENEAFGGSLYFGPTASSSNPDIWYGLEFLVVEKLDTMSA